MFKRSAIVAIACGGTVGMAAMPLTATANQHGKAIKVAQRIVPLIATVDSSTNVGASDGKIAGRAVHGALRAVATGTGPSSFTASGTLFYPAGTLTYTLKSSEAMHPDGSITFNGSGKFTGGTGTYVHAHGSFSTAGTKPANSFETWTLTGTVSYG